MAVYYNENDPFAAAWLRELMAAGAIPQGVVDERSIVEVTAADLAEFTQCHFFAGIGVWAYSLRQAGWPEDQPAWTGSCPCQPFSISGKRAGASDGRHLWPAWFERIRQCRPLTIFGEQVASDDGLAWLDLVSSDLENADYSCGAVDTCAAGFGAPHIRQRLYFVAVSDGGHPGAARIQRSGEYGFIAPHGGAGELADAKFEQLRAERSGSIDAATREVQTRNGERQRFRNDAGKHGEVVNVADAERRRCQQCQQCDTGQRPVSEFDAHGDVGQPIIAGLEGFAGDGADGHESRRLDPRSGGSVAAPSESGDMGNTTISGDGAQQGESRSRDGFEIENRRSGISFWADAEWIACRDSTYRPVEPFAQQVADGSTESLGSLRSDQIAEVTEEVLNVAGSEDRAREAMFVLRKALSTAALFQRSVRRYDGVYQAPILFAFLLQLAQQGWTLAEGVSRASKKAAWEELRILWGGNQTSCPSCKRGLDEQRSSECSDTLHLLSSILARHAQAAWGEAINKNAEATFPLIRGVIGRVGRLRGYGNALVAPQAIAFVKAFLDI